MEIHSAKVIEKANEKKKQKLEQTVETIIWQLLPALVGFLREKVSNSVSHFCFFVLTRRCRNYRFDFALLTTHDEREGEKLNERQRKQEQTGYTLLTTRDVTDNNYNKNKS